MAGKLEADFVDWWLRGYGIGVGMADEVLSDRGVGSSMGALLSSEYDLSMSVRSGWRDRRLDIASPVAKPSAAMFAFGEVETWSVGRGCTGRVECSGTGMGIGTDMGGGGGGE